MKTNKIEGMCIHAKLCANAGRVSVSCEQCPHKELVSDVCKRVQKVLSHRAAFCENWSGKLTYGWSEGQISSAIEECLGNHDEEVD